MGRWLCRSSGAKGDDEEEMSSVAQILNADPYLRGRWERGGVGFGVQVQGWGEGTRKVPCCVGHG